MAQVGSENGKDAYRPATRLLWWWGTYFSASIVLSLYLSFSDPYHPLTLAIFTSRPFTEIIMFLLQTIAVILLFPAGLFGPATVWAGYVFYALHFACAIWVKAKIAFKILVGILIIAVSLNVNGCARMDTRAQMPDLNGLTENEKAPHTGKIDFSSGDIEY
jgi:hypothetical protein